MVLLFSYFYVNVLNSMVISTRETAAASQGNSREAKILLKLSSPFPYFDRSLSFFLAFFSISALSLSHPSVHPSTAIITTAPHDLSLLLSLSHSLSLSFSLTPSFSVLRYLPLPLLVITIVIINPVPRALQ